MLVPVSKCLLLLLKDGKCLIINVFLSSYVTVQLQNSQNVWTNCAIKVQNSLTRRIPFFLGILRISAASVASSVCCWTDYPVLHLFRRRILHPSCCLAQRSLPIPKRKYFDSFSRLSFRSQAKTYKISKIIRVPIYLSISSFKNFENLFN